MIYLVKKSGRTISKHRSMRTAKANMKPGSYIVKRKTLYPRDK